MKAALDKACEIRTELLASYDSFRAQEEKHQALADAYKNHADVIRSTIQAVERLLSTFNVGENK